MSDSAEPPRVAPNPAAPDPAALDPAAPDPAALDPAALDPAAPDLLRPTKELRRRKRGGCLGTLVLYAGLLVVAFVIGVLFFNLVIMPAFVRRGDEVRVPDLTGKDLTAAEAQLKPTGLELGTASRRNDHRPVGTIVTQHPAAGTSVKRGRVVAIVVSLGERGIGIPRLLGETLQNARMALEQSELKTGDVVSAPCDSLPYNAVIASQPEPGAQVGRGTAVNLLVSAGIPRAALLMPDLAGRDVEGVTETLMGSGFSVTPRPDEGAAGAGRMILRTDPPAGARVRYGTAITLLTD